MEAFEDDFDCYVVGSELASLDLFNIQKNVFEADTNKDFILEQFFDNFDLNGDYQVSPEEITYRLSKRFSELTSENTGSLLLTDFLNNFSAGLDREFASIFKGIDKNNDGSLTASESINTFNLLVARGADADNNRQITNSEYVKYNKRLTIKAMFSGLDTDKDSKISILEFLDHALVRFQKWDVNNDKLISVEDFKKLEK